MIWDRKSTSFIDNTMITYNQIRLLLHEPGRDPLHQDPSAPLHMDFSSHTSSWEIEWVYDGGEGKIGEF
jgi:hypothetical protein